MPTAFNTSSDLAINKSWTLFGINSYPNAEIWVYNRWGTVVFYSKGFYTPFDGRSSSGAELPTGEYIYHILPNPEDVSFHFKGVVTIMR
ncbi:gliding motility-associated C-terminal domain-containing protein [Pseudarcicella hirudinis]|uniref:T9SS type B sorting domain-containing protein n=1 Tax=Pseudarcicella hirudinis TaxID=1079859 RepID=UPI0035ED1C8E